MTKMIIYNEQMEPICIVDLPSNAIRTIGARREIYIRCIELARLSYHPYTATSFVETKEARTRLIVQHVQQSDGRKDVCLIALGDEFEIEHTPPLPEHLRSSVSIRQQEEYNYRMRSLARSLESV